MQAFIQPSRPTRARLRRRPLPLSKDTYAFSDAYSGLYFSEKYNVRQIEILLRFEAETAFELSVKQGLAAA